MVNAENISYKDLPREWLQVEFLTDEDFTNDCIWDNKNCFLAKERTRNPENRIHKLTEENKLDKFPYYKAKAASNSIWGDRELDSTSTMWFYYKHDPRNQHKSFYSLRNYSFWRKYDSLIVDKYNKIRVRDRSFWEIPGWHFLSITRKWSENKMIFEVDRKYKIEMNNAWDGYHMNGTQVNLSRLRNYNRVLSESELDILYNEKNMKKLYVSNLSKDNINVDFSKLYIDDLKVDNISTFLADVNISYSLNNWEYTTLKTYNKALYQEKLTLPKIDLTSLEDGNNNLKIKFTSAGEEIIKEVNINKDEVKNNITPSVNYPNSLQAKITATSEFGTLYYNINKDNRCDAELEFNEYTKEVVFDNKSENWSYVCFKAIHGNDYENFKISDQIKGIWNKTTPVTRSNLFHDYKKWYKSSNVKDFDPILIMLKNITSISITHNTRSTSYPKMFSDVNGDSLPDMLITEYSDWYKANNQRYPIYSYALLINKWNLQFEVQYRCVIWDGVYWDCAK